MKIGIVTPASLDSTKGNQVTAIRWAELLKQLGHQVVLSGDAMLPSVSLDCLIAIHARKAHAAITEFHQRFPDCPILVCLSGTDLHGDLQESNRNNSSTDEHSNSNFNKATESLELATKIILLEPQGMHRLPKSFQQKCHLVFQSAEPLVDRWSSSKLTKFIASRIADHGSNSKEILDLELDGSFVVSVIGHLRDVKDPFRTALAARSLPSSSNLKILHVGNALDEEMRTLALEEMNSNPRYWWLGGVSVDQANQILGQSDVTVISSLMEGGCNVISEACVNRIPVICSEIDAAIGLLGADYPGLFPVQDTAALTRRLHQAESSSAFLEDLKSRVENRSDQFRPATERDQLKQMLQQIE